MQRQRNSMNYVHERPHDYSNVLDHFRLKLEKRKKIIDF